MLRHAAIKLFTLFHATEAFLLSEKRAISKCVELQVPGGSGDNPKNLSADSIYFEIEVASQPIGRLIFHLTNPSFLPTHAENII